MNQQIQWLLRNKVGEVARVDPPHGVFFIRYGTSLYVARIHDLPKNERVNVAADRMVLFSVPSGQSVEGDERLRAIGLKLIPKAATVRPEYL